MKIQVLCSLNSGQHNTGDIIEMEEGQVKTLPSWCFRLLPEPVIPPFTIERIVGITEQEIIQPVFKDKPKTKSKSKK